MTFYISSAFMCIAAAFLSTLDNQIQWVLYFGFGAVFNMLLAVVDKLDDIKKVMRNK